MKKLYTAAFLLAFLCFDVTATAQCTGQRYRDYVFDDVSLTQNVLYGSNIQWTGGSSTDLFFDVYEPAGDTETNRPVVILIHGGSFVGGSKTGQDVVPLANSFARMGYVAISMQYRLGMNTLPPDSTSATEAVIRGYHDCKAAIRYLRWDVDSQGNNYGIDPGQIFLAGVSAGGFVANHVAYLDEIGEMPSYVDYNKPGLGGGLEGLSGTPGYADTVSGIINICGALRDTAWMKAGDTPILSLHAVEDETVPYGKDVVAPFFNLPILVVCGSGPIHEKAAQVNMDQCLKTYQSITAGSDDHTPHVFSAAQYDTTLIYMRNFLVHMVCGDAMDCSYSNPLVLDVPGVQVDLPALELYPNPATDAFTVNVSAWNSPSVSLRLYDGSGKLVREILSNDPTVDIARGDLPGGIYMLQVSDGVYQVSRKVIFE